MHCVAGCIAIEASQPGGARHADNSVVTAGSGGVQRDLPFDRTCQDTDCTHRTAAGPMANSDFQGRRHQMLFELFPIYKASPISQKSKVGEVSLVVRRSPVRTACRLSPTQRRLRRRACICTSSSPASPHRISVRPARSRLTMAIKLGHLAFAHPRDKLSDLGGSRNKKNAVRSFPISKLSPNSKAGWCRRDEGIVDRIPMKSGAHSFIPHSLTCCMRSRSLSGRHEMRERGGQSLVIHYFC